MRWRDRSAVGSSRTGSRAVHAWEKAGVGLVAALLLALVSLVVLSPSSPSQTITIVTLAPSVPTTSTTLMPTTRAATIAPAPTTAPAATVPPDAITPVHGSDEGGGSRPPGCVDPDDCPAASDQTVDHGLRNATTAELTAIAAEVPPPPGQQIDGVMLSVSAPTWGVLHVAAGAGHGQTYVLIELFMNGKWAPVDSGYPRLRCDEAIPSDVLVDLGSVGTLCP